MNVSTGRLRDRAATLWSRRELFSLTAVATIASAVGLEGIARAATAKAARATMQDNVYTRLLGVRPVIGAFETLSRYGNSRMSPEVLQAMAEAQEYSSTWRSSIALPASASPARCMPRPRW
jgi:hypothetical protein